MRRTSAAAERLTVKQRQAGQSGGHRKQIATLPRDEAGRMAAVRSYQILGIPPDETFDRVAALAARFLGMPVASVTIVDRDGI
jgi:hypothetical protein